MSSPNPSPRPPETSTRFGRRLSERQAAQANGDPPPAATAEDSANMTDFEACLGELETLLGAEIGAIAAGDLARVEALFPAKAECLQRIELKLPVVEPFLADSLAADPALRARLAALRETVAEDMALLERMAAATRAIAREYRKIQDRHSLDGLYEKTGRKLGPRGAASRRIDENL